MTHTRFKQLCRCGLQQYINCLWIPYDFRKGKSRLYELMLKNSEVLDAFSQLGKSQVVPASVRKSVSMYTCNLYGGRGTFRDVNHARHVLLSKKIPQRKAKQNLTKLKSFDPATLPPCLCVLEQKITLSPMFGQMLTWLVSMNGTPSSMVGWRIRLEILALIGLTGSGF